MAHHLPESRKKKKLQRWLEDELLVRFGGQIAGIDTSVMRQWGRLMARLEAHGRALPLADSLVAAIALAGDFTVVTRNQRDFADAGVPVVNPWA